MEKTHACDECEYSTNKQYLKQHKQSKHDGVRYPCDQCDYAATDPSNLNKHQQSKQRGVRYPCDQCDYSATFKYLLL